jgi:hypothetical protein
MKLRICIAIFVASICSIHAFTQEAVQEKFVYNTYYGNIRDTTLSTGIYYIGSTYVSDEDYKYHVEYTQEQKDIETVRNFLLFRKRIPMHYIHSKGEIVSERKVDFIREMKDEWDTYRVDPLPLAAKENIIRVYDYSHIEYDSTITHGLTFKLSYCNDTSFKKLGRSPRRRDTEAGLIINDKLISAALAYFNEYPHGKNVPKDKYMVFLFPEYTKEEVDKIKQHLFHQTLILKK